MYGLNKDIEYDNLLSCLFNQNHNIRNNYDNSDSLSKDIRVFRYYSSKRDREIGIKNAVCAISYKLREIIVNTNKKIPTCLVKDYSSILYCYNCLAMGHIAKNCKNQSKCGKCGDNHNKQNCSSKFIKCTVCESKQLGNLMQFLFVIVILTFVICTVVQFCSAESIFIFVGLYICFLLSTTFQVPSLF